MCASWCTGLGAVVSKIASAEVASVRGHYSSPLGARLHRPAVFRWFSQGVADSDGDATKPLGARPAKGAVDEVEALLEALKAHTGIAARFSADPERPSSVLTACAFIPFARTHARETLSFDARVLVCTCSHRPPPSMPFRLGATDGHRIGCDRARVCRRFRALRNGAPRRRQRGANVHRERSGS